MCVQKSTGVQVTSQSLGKASGMSLVSVWFFFSGPVEGLKEMNDPIPARIICIHEMIGAAVMCLFTACIRFRGAFYNPPAMPFAKNKKKKCAKGPHIALNYELVFTFSTCQRLKSRDYLCPFGGCFWLCFFFFLLWHEVW